MTYVIGGPCVDVNDRACLDVCPVDCIYVGARKSYINPNECIECGACEPECPVEAIFVATAAVGDEQRRAFVRDNETFFVEVLRGRAAPLGDPGGAVTVGEIGVDTAWLSA